MAQRSNNKQRFKPQTKKTITAAMITKAKANKDIVPVAEGEIVTYRNLDGQRPFYKVLKVYMNPDDCMYEVTVQKIGSQGELMSQTFATTMDKLERYWLQPNDRITWRKKDRNGIDNTFSGTVNTMYHDRDNEMTIEVRNPVNSKSMLFYEDDLKYLDFQP